MGINFSRVLTLKYGRTVKDYLKRDKAVISVGRVMTCVLGMVVNREREIRSFVKTPFYRVIGNFKLQDKSFTGEWKATEGSKYFQSPLLYKENGFKEEKSAAELIELLTSVSPDMLPVVDGIEKKKENKNPPLLYNLAELQNDCSKYFKISPDQTLAIAQELYEKKLTTYPRTDARVLSTAVAKEIHKNIGGLKGYALCGSLAAEVLQSGTYRQIAKTRYVNDKQITDHYAIIPTGQGLNNLGSLSPASAKVYEIIVRRFLSIFYPPAVYRKFALKILVGEESFYSNFKVLESEGYLKAAAFSFKKDKDTEKPKNIDNNDNGDNEETEEKCDADFVKLLMGLKKGDTVITDADKPYEIKEGETSPPKRYTSGSIILTMENAGQFIEDEELRAQIKGSGIGTSATRAEILKKLVKIEYLNLNNKTQVLTPTLMGEMIYDVVGSSIKPLLDPALTASWEKGLTMVADGTITSDEYMKKLDDFVSRRTNMVKQLNNQGALYSMFREAETNYKK
jgi:DNA topoisomerase-3